MGLCNDSYLMGITSITKRIILLVQIIVPVLLIMSSIIVLMKQMNNLDEKNGKKIVTKFLAAIIVFLIPTIMNIAMFLLGEKTKLSSCWNNAEEKISAPTYIPTQREKKKIVSDSDSYEEGTSSTGLETAKLAMRVVPTATPERALHTPIPNEANGAWCKTKDERLYNYFKIMDETIGKYPSHDNNNPGRKEGINNNNAYASCAQAVVGIVRATVDPDFDSGSQYLALDYLAQNEDKWKLVARLKAGERYDSVCEPGDIIFLEQFSYHVMIYVGNELVREKFPNSNGDMYEASYSENRYPTITHHEKVYGSYARVYRSTGKVESYYPFIDIEETLSKPVNLKKQMC